MSRSQLFCFTHAGGSASFFDEIEKDLVGLDIEKLEYAGHGIRHAEPFYKGFDELADDMFESVCGLYKGGEYGLFGYSMGAITLVEVLKRITDSGMKLPINVFLAAHEPRTNFELPSLTDDKLDEWVMNVTKSFGAVPEKLFSNRVFWRAYLPIYRVDYRMIGDYKFERLVLNSSVPATIFYSETDTPFVEMRNWGKYFSCEFYHFEGTHFFIQENHVEMGKIIKNKMGVES